MRGVRRSPPALAAAVLAALAFWVAEYVLLGPRTSVLRPPPQRVEIRLDLFNESEEPVTIEEIAVGGSRRYSLGGYFDPFPLTLRPTRRPRSEFTTNFDLWPEIGTAHGSLRMRRGAEPEREEAFALLAPIGDACRLTVVVLSGRLAAEPCRPGLHLP